MLRSMAFCVGFVCYVCFACLFLCFVSQDTLHAFTPPSFANESFEGNGNMTYAPATYGSAYDSMGDSGGMNATWTTNYRSALQQAQRENKALLLFFTGSDWCTWCHRIEREILDRPECLPSLAQYFVFVKLDYPRSNSAQPPQEAQQNAALKQKFGVNQYPTILIVDTQEHVLGKTGYIQGGPKRFNATVLRMIGK